MRIGILLCFPKQTDKQTNTMLQQTTNQPRKHQRSSVSKLSFDIIRDTNHPDTLAPTHAQVHLLAPFHATPTSSPLLYNTPHLQERRHKKRIHCPELLLLLLLLLKTPRQEDWISAGTKFSTVEILSVRISSPFTQREYLQRNCSLKCAIVCSIPQLLSRVTAPMDCSCGSHFISPR